MACVGAFVAYVPVTTVSISLTAIQRGLGGSTADLSWVTTAFVLPMAACILIAGALGDAYGRKKVFLAGLLLEAVGALVGLSAGSYEVLWAGQAISGLGSAALLPSSLALISHAVPDHRERGRFIGLWATSLLLALALGPFNAGFVLEHTTWNRIYLAAVPIALLALVAGVFFLTDSRAPGSRRLDQPGQIASTIAVVALVYGVIEGGAESFTDTRVIAALLLAVVSGVAFVVIERRSASPMVDPHLFAEPGFSAATLVALITFMSMIGSVFVLSLYLGQVQHLSTLASGSRLFLFTVAPILVGLPVSTLMHRISPRLLITSGLILAALGMLLLTGIDETTSFWGLGWRLFLLGAALGAVITPMTATAVSSVPFRLAGMAAAGNNAFRQVGGALGPAVLGVVMGTRTSLLDGMHLAFTVCAGLMLLAAVVGLVLLPKGGRQGTTKSPAAPGRVRNSAAAQ
ncbi:MFS transporter [Kineosporia corallincola]